MKSFGCPIPFSGFFHFSFSFFQEPLLVSCFHCRCHNWLGWGFYLAGSIFQPILADSVSKPRQRSLTRFLIILEIFDLQNLPSEKKTELIFTMQQIKELDYVKANKMESIGSTFSYVIILVPFQQYFCNR